MLARFRFVWLFLLGSSICIATARAEPVPLERIPDMLEPWIPWVLEDLGDDGCPEVSGVRTCVWPSALELSVGGTGGTFTMRVTSERKRGVSLPGSIEHWPEDVRVNGKPMAVSEPEGAPQVVLEKGTHVITGRFTWPELPDSLSAPSNLGTLALSVAGSPVPFPRREASGLIWLQKGAGSESDADRLELTVHRKLTDGVPLVVVTRIQVSASGKAREVVLPSVLVPGTRAIQLASDLPAQLEPNGTLRMQAQGGDYRIEITAIRESPTDTLGAPRPGAPWPEHEIWVWSGDERLRHVELAGVPQIDPARTDLADDWRGMQTYVVPQGKGLTLTTRRRGEPEPPPNQLSLTRTMWLDLDGDGYTVSDRLSGTLSRSFRIDLNAGELGHAVVDGVDLLITKHEKKPGVELRSAALNLQTEWRLEHGRSSLPAVGYSEDVQSLSAELKLPPGFMLLGADGVDRIPGTWLDKWDLFDFFFVLVLSLAVAKLAGPAFGLLSLATLVLTHHEPEAPAMAWLFLLVCTAVLRVVKQRARIEKAVRGAFWLSLVVLLLVLVPFAVNQVREALYPHLAGGYGSDALGSQLLSLQEQAPMPAAAPEMPKEAVDTEGGALEESADSTRRAPMKSRAAADESASYGGVQKNVYARNEVDANAVVQTGPGVPAWSFQSFPLIWSGPVEKSQRIQLYIVPPALTRLWSLLNVLLSGLLLFALARAARTKAPSVLSDPPPPATAALLLLLAASLSASPANAQDVPPTDVLQMLRERLVAPAACEPGCVSVERLELTIEGARLHLRATVHAGTVVGYTAPGPVENWAPASVRVDGKEALALTRLEDGFLHVRLEPGLHTVELSGPLPSSQALNLALGNTPHRVIVRADGWVVEGLRADGRAEGSLVLRREVQVEDSGERAPQALAQWVEVRRELDLGVRFRVRTTITRLGPASESLLVRLPLLPGESMLGNGLTSDGKTVLIELGRDVPSAILSSTLAVTKRIDLRAALPSERPDGPVVRPWNESWVVRCSALYHCDFEGLAPVSRAGEDGLAAFSYRPWPGETLAIHAQRLEAEKGASVTIDRAALALTPGSRMEQAKLTLQVRTSRGTTEHIALPANSTLRSLTVDGAARPARIAKGKLEVSLDPGSHTIQLDLQAPRGMGFTYASDEFEVARPLVNVTTSVEIPRDRWLLFAYGPAWGPAVLFWGYLLVVVLAALALSRVPHTPLKPHEWLLLGLGLTQTEVPVVLIVVGWLFVLAFRARITKDEVPLFNLMQVCIALATVVALGCLAFAVHGGLVVQPDMQVEGMGSTNTHLSWYVDRTAGAIPTVGIVSLPLWTYKGLMLAWALWLAFSLIRWLRWGFTAFRHGGVWKPRKPHAPRAENPRVPPEQIAAAQAALDAQRGETPPRPDES